MGKYIVIINNRFIVNGIESTSAGGAEHKILDNYDGIIGAQAFGLDELGTDCFRGFCESCEMISQKELLAITRGYADLWEGVADAQESMIAHNRALAEAEAALEDAKARADVSRQEYENAKSAALAWQEDMGIPRELQG